MEKIIQGNDIAKRICDALGLKHVRRIILDFDYESVGKIYVEFLSDDRLYDIDFKDMKVVKAHKIEVINVTSNGDEYEKNILKKKGR